MSDIYHLHIDAVPVRPQVKQSAKMQSVHAPRSEYRGVFKKNNPQSVNSSAPRSLGEAGLARPAKPWRSGVNNNSTVAFIWDKIQFILVSAFVFAIIYTALNWEALAVNISYYWDKLRGFESPLTHLVADTPTEPEKLPTVRAASATERGIPLLPLEVAPPDTRLIIPRINKNVPVVGVKNDNLIARKWEQLEKDIQNELRNGVIHYPGTALPGDNGNVVLTGHSSYYAWDPGRFKDVFALLHDVRVKDKIIMYFGQKKFVYEVDTIKTVQPKDVDVLLQTDHEQLTLITCTPIGTNLRRLIVMGRLIEKK